VIIRLSPAPLLIAIGLAASACGGGEPEPAASLSVQPLSVRSVDWNPKAIPVGSVAAVAELGGTIVVLGDEGATLFSGGVYAGSDAQVTGWRSATTIPAADGNGTWIAGVDDQGRVLRLRAGSYFELVSDLYGLVGEDVAGVAALGGATVGFAIAGGLAVADGMTVTRYDVGPFTNLAGGGGRAATTDGSNVHVFVTSGEQMASYPLPGAEEVVFDEAGKLVVRTADSLYKEDESGEIVLLYESEAGAMFGLAVSAGRVWFGDGADLGMIEAGVVSRTTGGSVPPASSLLGSPSGDVWVLADGELDKYAAEVGDAEDRALWETKVQPVYLDSCTPCHAPGGSAGFELSTYGAWVARREAIKERVVDLKSMPPAGIPFTDIERKAIADWAGSAGK
jgi:mono/diheme cytochrome c family protein